MSVHAKICGLVRRADVVAADDAGSDYLGFVASPGFRRTVSLEALEALGADTRATRVVVLVDPDLEAAVDAATRLGAGVIQLHGSESPDLVRALRARGGWRVWKAVRVDGMARLQAAAQRFAGIVDALLVEGRRAGVVGGGGVRLDLDHPERIRSALPPDTGLVLAGGLTPDTVLQAAEQVRPDVVDVSSGVESSMGVKDPDQIRRFIEAAHGTHPTHASFPTSNPT